MAEDLGAQLKLQQDINAAIKARAGLLRQQSKMLGQQVQMAKELCASLDCSPFNDMSAASTELTECLEGTTEEMNQGLGPALDDMAEKTDDMTKNMGMMGAALGAVRGAIGGFKMLTGLVSGLFNVVGKLAGSFMNLAQTIISLPFKILTGLIQMSQRGGIDPLRVALEDVREEMGNLATNEGKALADSVGDMRSQMKDMAGTGLSMSRVFGYGREGLANFLKENLELAKAMGPAFSKLKGVFEKSSVSLAMYRKGLGLTAEAQAEMLKHAKAMGKDPVEEMDKFANMAIQMGSKYGVNAKIVGKAMAEMSSDVSTFGSMSRKHIGATATYAAKLGIEIKALAGLFDKFSNFEDAAKGAAEMSQAFGMNVDAMALLKAESPAQIADEIRSSFHAAGKSLSDMDRHQRALLEQQTGLKGADLEALMDPGNAGLAYEDIVNSAEEAENTQMSQIEMMKELNKSIKKLVKDGSHGFTSFFDAFAKGFNDGIMKSEEFRKLMRNLQASLWTIYRAGKAVGLAFVKYFPGVKDVFGGLADLFDPKRFQILADKLVFVFTNFFKNLSKDPQKAVNDLIDGLASALGMHGASGAGPMSKIKDGLMKMFDAVVGIIRGLLPRLLKEIENMLDTVMDLLVNPPDASKVTDGLGETGGRVMDGLTKIFDENKGAVKRIGDKLLAIFDKLWEYLEPHLQKLWDKIAPKMWYLLLPSLIFGAANAIGGFIAVTLPTILFKQFAKIPGLFTKAASSTGPGIMARMGEFFTKIGDDIAKLFPNVGKFLGKLGGKLGGFITSAFGKLLIVVGAAFSAQKIAGLLEGAFDEGISTAGQKIALMLTTVLDFLTFGLLSDEFLKDVANWIGNIGTEFEKLMDSWGLGALFDYISETAGNVFRTLSGLGDIIVGIFTLDGEKIGTGFLDVVGGLACQVLNIFTNIPKALWEILSGAFGLLTDGIKAVIIFMLTEFPLALYNMGKAIAAFVKNIPKYLYDALMAIDRWLSRVIHSFVEWGKDVWREIKVAFGIITDPQFWSDLIDDFTSGGAGLIDGLFEGLSAIGEKWDAFWDDVWKTVTDFWQVRSPSKKMAGLGTTMIDGLFKTLTFLPKKIMGLMKDAFCFITDVFGLDKLQEVGTNMVEGILSGLGSLKDAVKEKFSGAVDGVFTFLGIRSPSEKMANMGQHMIDGMSVGLKTQTSKLGGLEAQMGLGDLGKALQNFDKQLDFKHLSSPERADAIVKSIQTMNGILKPLGPTVKAVEKFKGGELKVHHTIPNTKVSVDVYLDGKKMGQRLAHIDIGKNNAKGDTYFGTQSQASADVPKL